ncbi:MAG: hypothetical protein K2X00_09795 [Nitrospiraceae bacterium]|nr:hypothetical protein [Nitrospiraceae bacterium]
MTSSRPKAHQKSPQGLRRMLGVIEASIQEETARRAAIRTAAAEYHQRIQSRLADLDEVGVGDPAQRGRLLTERHWCGVAQR